MKSLKKLNNNLKTAFSKLEHAVGPITKILLATAVIGSAVFLGKALYQEKSDITTSTVMITTLNGRSGGSGVVVSTKGNFSYILTNKHVCSIAAKGALVTTTRGQSHTILEYRESTLHDLCMITVAARLPNKVSLASTAPSMYERATISGHPALLPNVVTEGHFSGERVINVFLGFRPCTKEESEDPKTGGVCFFFRGLPVVQAYEAVLVTATIMPGSSGSAVYNSNKELSALVFAGSGEIGYAFAVPFEYVASFVYNEAPGLLAKRPNYKIDVLSEDEESKTTHISDAVHKCEKETENILDDNAKKQIKEICKLIIRDANWRF